MDEKPLGLIVIGGFSIEITDSAKTKRSPPPFLKGEEILDNLEQFEFHRVFDEGAETSNSELKGKTKGNANARRDLEELGIRLELWPYGGKYHKLEMIFLPSFFDSMEHLLVHLAYEALIAGPMHFRWMYPFERYMRKLKLNIKNNAAVEASICNAYLTEEASHFCPHYFESVRCRGRDVPHHDDGGGSTHPKDMLQIFTYDTICVGKGRTRFLLEAEYKAAHTYILLNTQEAKEFEQ
ncbi:hypothetical protein SASPL_152193 [Salvia splendens]|uniref:DUF4218 domain-containing protein n=1 Tax=Salvia splendens TaxID=180675 RepID=A0A8X8Z037_SALSN|nr:hypothetical protein SASPL_152193 [Salvia splendens]